MKSALRAFFSLTCVIAAAGEGGETRLTVDARATGVPVNLMLHGIFFEDINDGADGGLYAELVQNWSPRRETLKISSSSFPRVFAANSVTILRFKAASP